VLKEKPSIKAKEDKVVVEIGSQPEDRFGTFRASGRVGVRKRFWTNDSKLTKSDRPTEDSTGDDEVFHTSPKGSEDPFGTMKAANRVVNRPQQTQIKKPSMDDYRQIQPKNQQLEGLNNQNLPENVNLIYFKLNSFLSGVKIDQITNR